MTVSPTASARLAVNVHGAQGFRCLGYHAAVLHILTLRQAKMRRRGGQPDEQQHLHLLERGPQRAELLLHRRLYRLHGQASVQRGNPADDGGHGAEGGGSAGTERVPGLPPPYAMTVSRARGMHGGYPDIVIIIIITISPLL